MCFRSRVEDQPQDPCPRNPPCFVLLLLCLRRPSPPYFLGHHILIKVMTMGFDDVHSPQTPTSVP